VAKAGSAWTRTKEENGAMRMRTSLALFLSALALAFGSALPVVAQTSSSYRISDHTVNAGGLPSGGTTASSSSFQITLSSIGDGFVRPELTSASYQMDSSFTSCYPPPGEATGLLFTDGTTLTWDTESSAGVYNLYRADLTSLSGGGSGDCLQPGLPEATTTDSEPPGSGAAFFYLVTAENRLGEEGSRGSDSGGMNRGGSACP